jgi:hypothetical protein
MEYNENEWHISQNGHNTRGSSEHVQVPSSLLPDVLHRLGLSPEQALSEIAVDDLVANLKSDDWEVRVAAVRILGKLDTGAPVELLASVLDDADGSVRAAAVHALGQVGKRAPLHLLVAALHDPDWHVRETAVLALGKQGQRIPREVLMTALHDTDESVREAARLALEWNTAGESASYGQLWEQKTMQRDRDDTTLANSKEISTLFEAASYDARNGTIAGSRSSERVHGVQEQMQEYVPREYASYEYDSAVPSQWEKLTPRRRPQRGWWAVAAVAALLFFLMGGAITVSVMPGLIQNVKVSPKPVPQGNALPLERILQDPMYDAMLQKEIAVPLNLTPDQVRAQLKAGKSMTAIAAAQGLSPSQLRAIELKAFQDLFDTLVKAGTIDQQDADYWIQQFQNNPQLLDQMTIQAFVSPSR